MAQRTVEQRITPAMTVREVLTRFPHLEPVFDRHGLAGCGGPDGPLEPLGFFAAVHHVDPNVLLEELNAAVRQHAPAETVPITRTPQGPPPSHTPAYFLFFRTAIVLALTLGFTLGAVLLLTQTIGMPEGWGVGWWYSDVQLHGIVQIFGWLGLFIMGAGLHIVPRLKAVSPTAPAVARTIYAVVLGGLVLRITAHVLSQSAGPGNLSGLLGIAGGAALLIGSALFAWEILSALRRSLRPAEGFEVYLAAAVIWLMVGTATYLAEMLSMWAMGQATIPSAYNESVLHLLLVGFATQFTLGVSWRVLPSFLGIATPGRCATVAAFILVNLGLAVRTAGDGGAALLGLPTLDSVARLGALTEAGGLAVFALALRPWASGVPATSPGGYRGYARFIQVAYLWLVVAAVLEAGLALSALAEIMTPGYFHVSAARHALALGFLTLMVMGIALRTVPVFGGTQLVWPRLGDGAFWLVLASVSLRVPLTLANGLLPDLGNVVNGLSGILGAVGLVCWSIVIWRTLDRSGTPARHHRDRLEGWGTPSALPSAAGPQQLARQEPLMSPAHPAGNITAQMTPADVLEQYPQTLTVFLEFGFDALRDADLRTTLGRSVTLEQAAEMRRVDLPSLLAALERAVHGLQEPSPPQRTAPMREASAPGVATSPAPAAASPVSKTLVRMALKACYDPEIPVNIVDLGLVYDLRIEGNTVRVEVGLTSPDCPVGEQLVADVAEALLGVPGVEEALVRIAREPHWSPERMSAAARAQLGWSVDEVPPSPRP